MMNLKFNNRWREGKQEDMLVKEWINVQFLDK